MTLDDYQGKTTELAVYPGRGDNQLIYPAISLVGEAGELATAIMQMAVRQIKPHNYALAIDVLDVAGTCGALMELMKKAYRNDPAGELTPERKKAIYDAIDAAGEALDVLRVAVEHTQRVEFPPVCVVEPPERERMVKEAGDALWYVSAFCTEMRVSLGCVAQTNYDKLTDRAHRGVLRGSGDNR
jgi:NTP pyrophosphatase (non-canonical NTP hydrolase)